MASLTNPEAVLSKLKRSRPSAQWGRHTGVTTGRLLDPRFSARMTSAVPPNGVKRARWNTAQQRFELTTATGTAISEFFLNEALANVNYGTDTRAVTRVRYNASDGKNQGWVWAENPAADLAYATPGANDGPGVSPGFDPVETAPPPPTGGGGPLGGVIPQPPVTPVGPTPVVLPTPIILPGGGTYAYEAFPSAITITPNGAPAGGSSLRYSLNGGAWLPYGGPFPVNSGDQVRARNISNDLAQYLDSGIASSTYYRLIPNVAGTGFATWGNAIGGPNLVSTASNSMGTSSITHGNTRLDLGNGEFLDAGISNMLSFSPAAFADIKPNAWFNLGGMTMRNGTTFYDSEASSVTLSVNLSMTSPPLNDVVHIDLGFISTENTSDPLASADIVELRNPSTDLTFAVGGVTYRLELSWVSMDPAAGIVRGNQFLIIEGATAAARLQARFVSFP
jgi:hypothetical protein